MTFAPDDVVMMRHVRKLIALDDDGFGEKHACMYARNTCIEKQTWRVHHGWCVMCYPGSHIVVCVCNGC